jgi:cysteine desulfurase
MVAERYFDHAATTPLDPQVIQEMLPFMGELAGNSESIHAFGQRAKAAVELARQRIADAVGAEAPEQIVFTSGSTEACNAVIRSFPAGVMSPFEHSAVREPGLLAGYQELHNVGTTLMPAAEPVALVAAMAVNNEIGTHWNPAELKGQADAVFADATQALGKTHFQVDGLDYAALSAHKVYGPQGVGAMYVANDLPQWQLGGEQELGRRAGTLNVAGAVAFGVAVEIAMDKLEGRRTHAENLRSVVLAELQELSDWRVNGEPAVPHILSISVAGIEGETAVVELDHRGFAVSAGAACSSRKTEPSHVLTALQLPEHYRRGTVRISFGDANSPESARDLGRALSAIIANLRSL